MTERYVLLGGGGFSIDADPGIDRYLAACAGKPRPSVCFVPTASGDSQDYCRRFREAYEALDCETHVLSLFRPALADLREYLCGMDVIFVGGGSTKNLLVLWREWRLEEAILAAANHGTVVSGVSAGLLCWFEEGITDSEYGAFRPLPALGRLRGLVAPHFDCENGRRDVFEQRFAEADFEIGYGVPDGVALEFEGNRFIRCVSTREGGGAHVYAKSADGTVSRHFVPSEPIA